MFMYYCSVLRSKLRPQGNKQQFAKLLHSVNYDTCMYPALLIIKEHLILQWQQTIMPHPRLNVQPASSVKIKCDKVIEFGFITGRGEQCNKRFALFWVEELTAVWMVVCLAGNDMCFVVEGEFFRQAPDTAFAILRAGFVGCKKSVAFPCIPVNIIMYTYQKHYLRFKADTCVML